MGGRAWNSDADLFTRNNTFGCGQLPSSSLLNIFDNPLELDGIALITEVGTPLITRVGREERAIRSKDLIREEPQMFSDVYQDVEDVIVQIFS